MSSQKGNVSRKRPQKHQNRTAFKNTLHDTSHRTKSINNTRINNVCIHCKEVIQWKIKYKKYKPLSQLKSCVRCNQKSVRHAYHVMCSECARAANSCAKCCKSNVEIEMSLSEETDDSRLTGEMKQLLKLLPERKRRTFLRSMEKRKAESQDESSEDLLEKLKSLALEQDDNEDNDEHDFDLSDSNSLEDSD